MSEVSIGTLYDYNKELSNKEKPLDIIALNRKIIEIKKQLENTYYMLLCNERKDYTVFNCKQALGTFDIDLRDTLFNRGQVISIDLTTEGAWEIWLRIDNEDFCYHLFDYTFGVVEVEDSI